MWEECLNECKTESINGSWVNKLRWGYFNVLAHKCELSMPLSAGSY